MTDFRPYRSNTRPDIRTFPFCITWLAMIRSTTPEFANFFFLRLSKRRSMGGVGPVSIRKYRYTGSHLAQRMIDRLLNLSHRKSCEILSAGCAFFPDASIDEQLGMIALPVGDRSVGNERAGLRSARAFEPLVGSLMPQRNRIKRPAQKLSVQFPGSVTFNREEFAAITT
jgi:hypothetical protein